MPMTLVSPQWGHATVASVSSTTSSASIRRITFLIAIVHGVTAALPFDDHRTQTDLDAAVLCPAFPRLFCGPPPPVGPPRPPETRGGGAPFGGQAPHAWGTPPRPP